jgi:hypothetical protein
MMRLNQQEFERFRAACKRLKRAKSGHMKSDLELAVTMVEDLSREHVKTVRLAEILIAEKKRSLCSIVPYYVRTALLNARTFFVRAKRA